MEQIQKNKEKLSSFSVILIMVVLMVIGAAMIPLLNIQYTPSTKQRNISVTYSWPGASARVMESEVTSKLEGVLNMIRGVQRITSTSSRNNGSINLSFKDTENIDALRFEIATLIKRIYPDLPQGVSYPNLSAGTSGRSVRPLLTYTINSSLPTSQIRSYMEDHVLNELADLDGVNDVSMSGDQPYQWNICFNASQCRALNIAPEEIAAAVNRRFKPEPLGLINEYTEGDTLIMQVSLRSGGQEEALGYGGLEALPVKKVDGRIIYLGDVASVVYKEAEPTFYYRINGRNNLNMTIYPAENINTIQVSNQVKDKMEEIQKRVPPEYVFILNSDSSEYIKGELNKIYRRTIMSIVILLLFVFLVSRKFRYLALIVVTLLANILLSFVFYYLFNIELHLYSLAGVTVSLGLVIDTTIIMIDHYSYYRNRKAFLAILAALLTTIGALSIVSFLPEDQKMNLIDFASVIIINLTVSLFIALFFVPALLEKLPIKQTKTVRQIRHRRRLVKTSRWYSRHIVFSKRHKWVYIVFIILIFGLPVHLLPDKIREEGNYYNNKEKEGFFPELYNKTIGSTFYQGKLKKIVEYSLGGSLRLFSQHFSSYYRGSMPERSSLTIMPSLPEGCTVHQLNDVVLMMENFLSGFEEIDQYETTVSGYDYASIYVTFKKASEKTGFPLMLKERVVAKAINIGGADWRVFGIDNNSFSNSLSSGGKANKIKLRGYNYEQLYKYARQLCDSLATNRRVSDPEIAGASSYYYSRQTGNKTEFYLDFDFERFAYHGVTPRQYYSFLNSKLYRGEQEPILTKDGTKENVFLFSDEGSSFDIWHLENDMVSLGDDASLVKLTDLGTIEKKRTGNDISKENQEYILNVGYEFQGANELEKRLVKRNVEMINNVMPLGYKAEDVVWGGGWYQKSTPYILLALVIVIIYFICAILFESLIQPFAIVLMIPISFVGLFLVFPLFNFPLDQGGFAAMVLLSGIVVNAGIYIINEYNLLRKKGLKQSIPVYLKAYNHKIIPIMLTILSTILGLIPFIWDGKGEAFWFSFAVGAMGGMIFSILALIVFLPLFIPMFSSRSLKKK